MQMLKHNNRNGLLSFPLKVLSSEMDPAEIRLILNSRAPSHTVIGHQALNGQRRSKAHSALSAPLVLHNTRNYKCAMKKITYNGQRRNEHFLIVIYHSSLVKGAMNAARLCKLRNGVKKTPQFLLLLMGKGGPSAQ